MPIQNKPTIATNVVQVLIKNKKMKSKGWIFILLIVVFSCSSENGTIKLFKKDKINNNLLNRAIFQSELENMLAFPVLFNDSIVKKNKIATIKRKQLFKHNENDGEASEIETDKIITYFFDDNGHNSKIKVEKFYDIKSIEKIVIHFSEYDSNNGYAKHQIIDSSPMNESTFANYQLTNERINFIKFHNDLKGNNLYLIPSSKFWKPLVIDTMCNPQKQDIIVLGTLRKPQKIYSVKDLVNETNVRKFTYKHNLLKKIVWDDQPFTVNREFEYNDKGICIGFTDKVYSIKALVNKTHYSITLKGSLPIKVTKEIRVGNKLLTIYEEMFTYTYN